MQTITGADIPKARLLVLRAALSLEVKGMTRRGRSVYSIVKDEFGFRGSKKRVFEQLEAHIESLTCPGCGKWLPDEEFRRSISRYDSTVILCPSCGEQEALEGVSYETFKTKNFA